LKLPGRGRGSPGFRPDVLMGAALSAPVVVLSSLELSRADACVCRKDGVGTGRAGLIACVLID
jgi:hypothetical protein